MMKRLLIINSRFLPVIGGGETYTLELMDYFSQNDYEVHLVTQQRGYGKEKWKDCYVHYIEGFDDHSINLDLCVPAMRQLLDTINPDIIHIHNIMPFFVYSIATRINEYPTVLTIHNTPHLPYRLFGNFDNIDLEINFCRMLFHAPHCDKVLFGSRYYLDEYTSVVPELASMRCEVSHYFPAKQAEGPRHVRGRLAKNKAIHVLFPSRIIERKGIEDVLHAISLLPDTYILLLPAFASAGKGEYTQKILHRIDELRLTDRIKASNLPVLPSDMPRYFSNADVVVIPSHYEGFGIVALEAMTWRVPVITTGVGGIKEIVQDGESGVVVPVSDPTALARAIRTVVNNPELRERITNNAYHEVTNRFTRRSHMERLQRTYEEVMKRMEQRLE